MTSSVEELSTEESILITTTEETISSTQDPIVIPTTGEEISSTEEPVTTTDCENNTTEEPIVSTTTKEEISSTEEPVVTTDCEGETTATTAPENAVAVSTTIDQDEEKATECVGDEDDNDGTQNDTDLTGGPEGDDDDEEQKKPCPGDEAVQDALEMEQADEPDRDTDGNGPANVGQDGNTAGGAYPSKMPAVGGKGQGGFKRKCKPRANQDEAVEDDISAEDDAVDQVEDVFASDSNQQVQSGAKQLAASGFAVFVNL